MERKVKTLGFVNVDKPSGITSSAVVNRVKRLTGLPCGHMGTLDPLASGVLPVGTAMPRGCSTISCKRRRNT